MHTLPNPTQLTQPGSFVGREAMLAEFQASLDALSNHNSSDAVPFFPQTFLLQGASGSGKSALLQQLVQLASTQLPRERVVVIELANRPLAHVEGLIVLLSAAIREYAPHFDQRTRAARALRASHAQRYELVCHEWQRWLAASHAARTTPPATNGFDGPAAPYLAELARRQHDESSAPARFLQARGVPPASLSELLAFEFGADAALLDGEAPLWQAFSDDIASLAQGQPLVLALDGYARFTSETAWLNLVTYPIPRNVLMLVASRLPLDADYRASYGSLFALRVSAYNLDQQPLTRADIQHYLVQRTPADNYSDELLDRVMMLSRGMPLAVEALANRLALAGDLPPVALFEPVVPQGPALIATLARALYAAPPAGSDPLELQRLLALALLQQPDIELLAALWDVPASDAEALAEQLASRYSFMFEATALRMRAVPRDTLRASASTHPAWPELVAGLQRCMPILQGRTSRDPFNLDTIDPCSFAPHYQAIRELLAVQLQIGAYHEASRLLLNTWVVARYCDSAAANGLAELASELAPRDDEWPQLVQALNTRDKYALLAPFNALLNNQSRAVLLYLRAQATSDERQPPLQQLDHRISLLDQVNRLAPDWQRARTRLALAYAERGHHGLHEPAPALADFERALELLPSPPAWLALRASLRASQGNLSGALHDYDQALALQPSAPRLHLLRGVTRGHLNDLPGALQDFEQALAAEPDDHDIRYYRAISRGMRGDLAGALEDLELAVGDGNQVATDRIYKRGLVRGALGNHQGALADFEYVLARRPNDADALYRRGLMRDRLGETRTALADYDRVLALRPDDPDALYNRGFVRGELGDRKGALADYDRVLALRPDDADALYNRGVIRGELGDHKGALADYNRVLAQRPDDPDALYNRGVIAYELGEPQAALADYNRALELRPDDPDVLVHRAICRSRLSDLAGALADCNQALALRPDEPAAIYQRGNIRSELGDPQGALADYTHALERNPTDPDVLYRRGVVRASSGDIHGALADYNRALELRPDDANVLYHRGVARSAIDDSAGALADFDMVLALRPDDATARHRHTQLATGEANANGAAKQLRSVVVQLRAVLSAASRIYPRKG